MDIGFIVSEPLARENICFGVGAMRRNVLSCLRFFNEEELESRHRVGDDVYKFCLNMTLTVFKELLNHNAHTCQNNL